MKRIAPRRPVPPLAAALSAVALATAAGCGGAAVAPPPPAVPVTVATVERASVPVEWRGVGAAEPVANVAVRSQVGGTLERVHFEEGRDVRPGELLFSIDPRPYASALRSAEAQLARDQALAQNAAADAARYADLAKKEYVTAEEYEAKRSNATALEATVAADRAAIERAQLDLDHCSIRSPIAGRTGSLAVYAGNLVKANDDQPMVLLQQMQPIRVAFSVPQQLLGEIRRRSGEGALQVTAATPDGVAQAGELTFVDNAVDSASGTIALKATFANAERALWPGEFVQVTLRLSTLADAIVTPSSAIQTGQNGAFVYVVAADGTAAPRNVRLGPVAGERTVVTDGLAGGETVVTDGQLRLFPGAKVEIKAPAAAPTSAGAP
jgi:multidrug efflux system membrane fusion protein